MKLKYFDLLSGEPIYADGIGHLRSPKLRDICPSSGIGYGMYDFYVSFLTWDKDRVLQYDEMVGLRAAHRLAEEDKLSAFDVITIVKPTRELCREVLSFFMTDEVVWDENSRVFTVYDVSDGDDRSIAGEINRKNFEEVRTLMMQLNFLGLNKNTQPVTHTSEHSKELWEKAQKYLKQQSKQDNGEDNPAYHIGNVISKLCAAHPSYNLLNVFDLTVFQLFDAFFQTEFLRSSSLSERIFSNHGGDKFRFEDWLTPIFPNA